MQSVLNKSVIFFAHQIAFLHIQNVTEFTVDEKNCKYENDRKYNHLPSFFLSK